MPTDVPKGDQVPVDVKQGDQFKSEVEGVPVILEVDEVVMVDKEKGEAVLKTHLVRVLGDGKL
jgi:hypothetical protein